MTTISGRIQGDTDAEQEGAGDGLPPSPDLHCQAVLLIPK